jgi:hypothetical protein
MKRLFWLLAMLVVPAILAAAGLFLVHRPLPARAAPSDTTATVKPTASPSPASTVRPSGSPRPAPRQAARPRHHHAGPWAVVSAYYRDIDSRKYARAWALIRPAMAAGQTYQQFVSGYACTGTERPTRLSQSGHQVSFNLTVVNTCTAAFQYYTGTDTVRGGKIIAAGVTRTG